MSDTIKTPEVKPLELSDSQKVLVIDYMWQWLWKFIGLVILIVGAISGVGIYAAKTTIQSKANEFQEKGANLVANNLSTRSDFVNRVAVEARALPVGTVLLWVGSRKDIPNNWAVCDGTYPEPNWPEKTPDLRGRVIIGSEQYNLKEATPITITKPALDLEAGGGNQDHLNQALGDGGINVHWQDLPGEKDFFERVLIKTKKGDDQIITISTENIPRADVVLIIRYK